MKGSRQLVFISLLTSLLRPATALSSHITITSRVRHDVILNSLPFSEVQALLAGGRTLPQALIASRLFVPSVICLSVLSAMHLSVRHCWREINSAFGRRVLVSV
jgi:ABC-type siderophore export system fused ATPase/permease subunit